jgi:dihydroxyacid dehydratase/phosphogluconate dehydratase
VALITDGRFSGATHGFMAAHVAPEAVRGGPIAALADGDEMTIDVAAPHRRGAVRRGDRRAVRAYASRRARHVDVATSTSHRRGDPEVREAGRHARSPASPCAGAGRLKLRSTSC